MCHVQSLMTGHLLNFIDKPGLPLMTFMPELAAEVHDESKKAFEEVGEPGKVMNVDFNFRSWRLRQYSIRPPQIGSN
jgi:hypothetical protein